MPYADLHTGAKAAAGTGTMTTGGRNRLQQPAFREGRLLRPSDDDVVEHADVDLLED